MKKIIALLLIVTTIMVLALSANADVQGNVKKGTPTIDGNLDNLYKSSLCLKGHPDYVGGGDGDKSSVIAANELEVYCLWDASALYFFVVCYDATIGSGDRITFMPVMNSTVKTVTITPSTGDVEYSDAYDTAASHVMSGENREKGYVWCEAKLVITDEFKSSILFANNTIQFHLAYWNDINNDGADDNFTTTGFFNNHHIKLIGTAATGTGNADIPAGNGAGQTGGGNTTTGGGANTNPGDNGGNNNNNNPPQTSDSIVIVSAVALCAAAAAVIIAKRKRA